MISVETMSAFLGAPVFLFVFLYGEQKAELDLAQVPVDTL